jgi:signal peptidase I
MRLALAAHLTRYPATFAAALALPHRLPDQAPGQAWCPPVTFALISALIGYLLSALSADDAVYRHYEWSPALTPLLGPLSRLPGIAFLFNAGLAAAGIAIAAAIVHILLRLSGSRVPLRSYAAALLYFAGGPMLLVTLAQSVGLPLILGGAITFPQWLRTAIPLALALYLLAWLAMRFATLPTLTWRRGAVAAAVAALVFMLLPPDRRAMLRLEPYGLSLGAYAMTTDSMAPQIEEGSVAIANGAVYGWRQPAHGDLVVFFKTVGGVDVAVLRRVVGLGGDTVALRGGRVSVNGVAAARETLADGGTSTVFRETLPSGVSYRVVELNAGGPNDELAPVPVPPAYVYVLADNRDTALDSRQFGPIAISDLKGIVYYQLSPARRPLR